MPLICDMGFHRASPYPKWRQGFYFDDCRRCGKSIARTAYEKWHVTTSNTTDPAAFMATAEASNLDGDLNAAIPPPNDPRLSKRSFGTHSELHDDAPLPSQEANVAREAPDFMFEEEDPAEDHERHGKFPSGHKPAPAAGLAPSDAPLLQHPQGTATSPALRISGKGAWALVMGSGAVAVAAMSVPRHPGPAVAQPAQSSPFGTHDRSRSRPPPVVSPPPPPTDTKDTSTHRGTAASAVAGARSTEKPRPKQRKTTQLTKEVVRDRSSRRTAKPKIKYKYSANMQVFCERAGRSTPECKIFRQQIASKRR